ncbi:hypothetical protein [Marispirochaeta aestuarii]|uniref:hypothetical protein n=1 Tax=Marispirochaeta aestuarii TaxID=1963862 RepID=UPI002ABE98EC|nr:hypothetical protein [Marispirochaeta aestuarii]
MKILKYTKGGLDPRHDVHYIQQETFCRFGSNEEPPKRMIKALQSLREHCSVLARIDVEIKRITFSEPEINETRVSFEVIAAASNGQDMKITLPKVGWRTGSREIPGGEFEKTTIPKEGIDLEFVNAIKEVIESLKDYVINGAGQLDFNFDIVEEGKTLGLL